MSNNIELDEFKNALRKLINDAEKNQDSRKLIADLVELGSLNKVKSSQGSKKSTKTTQPNINPFEIFRVSGSDGLKKELSKKEHDILLNIVKYYSLDPSRKSYRWRHKDKLVKLIIDRVHDMSVQGNVFSR